MRDFSIGTVNIETGEFTVWDRNNITIEDLPEATMSSASIPVVFQPRLFRNELFMDGGTVWNLNADSAIQGCLSKGFTESQIIVDVMICDVIEVDDDFQPGHTIGNWRRARKIRSYYGDSDSMTSTLAAYPDAQWRYLFQ